MNDKMVVKREGANQRFLGQEASAHVAISTDEEQQQILRLSMSTG